MAIKISRNSDDSSPRFTLCRNRSITDMYRERISTKGKISVNVMQSSRNPCSVRKIELARYFGDRRCYVREANVQRPYTEIMQIYIYISVLLKILQCDTNEYDRGIAFLESSDNRDLPRSPILPI